MALEALDIGAGDEVIVPILTWVATATAVLNVNAVPIFVDVEPETGCIDATQVEASVTQRTKAILAVHLHCTMANVEALAAIASRNNIWLVEDCAQAHGATWLSQRAGTFGVLGAFSMQQSKILTAGEGGAVITRDAALYERLQQLRADSRVYSSSVPEHGAMYLVPSGNVMGTNYCLSEVQAAILLEGLDRLDDESIIRERRAAFLDRELGRIPGVVPLRVPPQVTRRAVYEYGVRIDPDHFGGKTAEVVAKSLQRELAFAIYPTDLPLHLNPLYAPLSKKRYRIDESHMARLDLRGRQYPAAERFWSEFVAFHHSVLLTDREETIGAIVDAFETVRANLAAGDT
jgi:L-glutamine:2-deoxy-scyllo-inosose/3-amino-2,3-dideoxy-scyllo-inosose aminotransferase